MVAGRSISQQMTTLEATEEEEANARQLAELEFIQSAYTSEEAWAVVTTTENVLSISRSINSLAGVRLEFFQ